MSKTPSTLQALVVITLQYRLLSRPAAKVHELEEYQRDLEQEVADVAQRIKQLRESAQESED